MKITYIIGNGFDINLGLQTRYADFYKWYTQRPAEKDPEAVDRFKKEINEYLERGSTEINWSDLESALGVYTSKVPRDHFRDLYFNIVDSLKEYLSGAYRYFNKEDYNVDLFKYYLANPITDNFNLARKQILAGFRKRFSGNTDYINIISFNYTNSIEDLIGFHGIKQQWIDDFSKRAIILENVYHLHHTLSEQNILVGVNDASQIVNESYRQDKNICDYLIKPNANIVISNYVDWKCEALINETNLFVLYGTSVGDTDRKWWNIIGNRLVSSRDDACLLWFSHCPGKVSHSELLYLNEERTLKPQFYKVSNLKNYSEEALGSKIFVTISDKLFSNLKCSRKCVL